MFICHASTPLHQSGHLHRRLPRWAASHPKWISDTSEPPQGAGGGLKSGDATIHASTNGNARNDPVKRRSIRCLPASEEARHSGDRRRGSPLFLVGDSRTATPDPPFILPSSHCNEWLAITPRLRPAIFSGPAISILTFQRWEAARRWHERNLVRRLRLSATTRQPRPLSFSNRLSGRAG